MQWNLREALLWLLWLPADIGESYDVVFELAIFEMLKIIVSYRRKAGEINCFVFIYSSYVLFRGRNELYDIANVCRLWKSTYSKLNKFLSVGFINATKLIGSLRVSTTEHKDNLFFDFLFVHATKLTGFYLLRTSSQSRFPCNSSKSKYFVKFTKFESQITISYSNKTMKVMELKI